jgi:hypothetical protein
MDTAKTQALLRTDRKRMAYPFEQVQKISFESLSTIRFVGCDSALCNVDVRAHGHCPTVSELAYFKAADGQPSSFLASRNILKSTISAGAISFSILLLILTNSMLREIPFSLTSPFWL